MEHNNYDLEFKGKGGEYFSIFIVNWLLTIVTLGLYYPWAKAKVLKYVYANTELEGHPFAFHGTGKEMFAGFIKGILIFGLIFGLGALAQYYEQFALGAIILYGGVLAIIPLAIHGTLRYRMSRSSYRGVHFGYRGDRNELYGLFGKGILLTIVTFTIYSSWFEMDLRKYIQRHSRFGNSKFQFNGKGGEWFTLNLIGVLLSLITLYIYSFKWMADRFNYMVDNSSWSNESGSIQFKGTATGMAFFELLVINLLIIIFTLGIGAAWVEMRTAKFYADHIQLQGNLSLDSITQTEADHLDATGDELMDMLDMDIFF